MGCFSFSPLLFREDWISSTFHFDSLPPVHSCLLQRWVPSQLSTRRCSYPTMRRCLLLCRWSGGPRRRSLSWPLAVRETTWPSSASQVGEQISSLHTLHCCDPTFTMSPLILLLMFTLMSMFTFPLPIERHTKSICCSALGQSFLNRLDLPWNWIIVSPEIEV